MLKVFSSFTLFLLCLGIFPQAVFAQLTIMQKMSLRTCESSASKKCMIIDADQAESSQFTPLFTLSNYKVTLRTAQDEKVLTGKFGYIDYSNDLVVLTLTNGADYSINLKTLQEKDYSK